MEPKGGLEVFFMVINSLCLLIFTILVLHLLRRVSLIRITRESLLWVPRISGCPRDVGLTIILRVILQREMQTARPEEVLAALLSLSLCDYFLL